MRPTSDRVREATFNALASQGVLSGATVVDLFAGTGALGIEALSRGAAKATFVGQDRRNVELIRRNLAATGLADRATLVRGDATTWSAGAGEEVDLVLADPPYRFDGWTPLLAALRSTVVVVESDREIDLGDRWELVRGRRYGGTWVGIARCLPSGEEGEVP